MRRARQPDSLRAGASQTPTRRARATAWLGLFALVLALVAPLISQLRASAIDPHAPFAAICSASGNPFAAHPEPHAPSGTHVDRCGYCGLLAGHPPLQYAVSFCASPAVRHAPPELPVPSAHRPAKRYALAARGPPAARA
ncbi:DUF2946 domain-containing protein [Burkholderia pseudomultivorans]|uniref:DUF2946 domain-containing protein n=1 Tax=Burkholderia pseudomultivorans TaxID=1207504 RepID=UPI00075E258B|nr:DUF2946 domain-containing protein [Burkholderia pseudomultivorans]AOI90480.1 hypothetical protein WS57_16615 [Burkholderia pseudomultivorans]KVC27354.1 hypothetical protein WS55_13270 [Burkholderia pseudomultivorans]KVC37933.1 hypothetical protein WS56_04090 [Burkholderia pseudomultivorans]KVC47762.1 hypothetical protein WS58_09425 [Burkholderia pseudomultivorans]MDS0791484.1 DUF2946 domain-containing protein [Burkholderia pseudomultivorans]